MDNQKKYQKVIHKKKQVIKNLMKEEVENIKSITKVIEQNLPIKKAYQDSIDLDCLVRTTMRLSCLAKEIDILTSVTMECEE